MKLRLTTMVFALLLSSHTYAAEDVLADKQLRQAIESRLIGQLNDEKVAKKLASFLMQQVLTWKAETLEVEKADSIIAYAFGNRIAENGNKLPGAMNQQLADMVVDIYNKSPMPVYAQWEVAEAIGGRIATSDLVPVYPKIDDAGQVIYLSTLGVAEETVRLAKGADELGTALVIAFFEHHLRAVNLSREVGIDAYAPQGYTLPGQYDARSAQPWTQDSDIFTFYEVGVRASHVSKRLIAEKNN